MKLFKTPRRRFKRVKKVEKASETEKLQNRGPNRGNTYGTFMAFHQQDDEIFAMKVNEIFSESSMGLGKAFEPADDQDWPPLDDHGNFDYESAGKRDYEFCELLNTGNCFLGELPVEFDYSDRSENILANQGQFEFLLSVGQDNLVCMRLTCSFHDIRLQDLPVHVLLQLYRKCRILPRQGEWRPFWIDNLREFNNLASYESKLNFEFTRPLGNSFEEAQDYGVENFVKYLCLHYYTMLLQTRRYLANDPRPLFEMTLPLLLEAFSKSFNKSVSYGIYNKFKEELQIYAMFRAEIRFSSPHTEQLTICETAALAMYRGPKYFLLHIAASDHLAIFRIRFLLSLIEQPLHQVSLENLWKAWYYSEFESELASTYYCYEVLRSNPGWKDYMYYELSLLRMNYNNFETAERVHLDTKLSLMDPQTWNIAHMKIPGSIHKKTPEPELNGNNVSLVPQKLPIIIKGEDESWEEYIRENGLEMCLASLKLFVLRRIRVCVSFTYGPQRRIDSFTPTILGELVKKCSSEEFIPPFCSSPEGYEYSSSHQQEVLQYHHSALFIKNEDELKETVHTELKPKVSIKEQLRKIREESAKHLKAVETKPKSTIIVEQICLLKETKTRDE